MKIVVQVEPGSEGVKRVFISLDQEGIDWLKENLGSPNLRKPMDSLDLFTEEWGGQDLESEPIVEGCEVVNHLEFLYLGDSESKD